MWRCQLEWRTFSAVLGDWEKKTKQFTEQAKCWLHRTVHGNGGVSKILGCSFSIKNLKKEKRCLRVLSFSAYAGTVAARRSFSGLFGFVWVWSYFQFSLFLFFVFYEQTQRSKQRLFVSLNFIRNLPLDLTHTRKYLTPVSWSHVHKPRLFFSVCLFLWNFFGFNTTNTHTQTHFFDNSEKITFFMSQNEEIFRIRFVHKSYFIF